MEPKSQAEDDRAIIDLYFARDETAIRLSQDRYGDYCMSVALYILRDRMDAEECVNDTWLRAWRAIPPTRPVSLRAFLAKITRNLSLDRWDRHHAAKRKGELAKAMDELYEAACVPDEAENRLPGLFDEFLSGLPARERIIFVRRYWYGMSAEEIAAGLNTTRNAVWMQLSRTRNRFRTFLNERGYQV